MLSISSRINADLVAEFYSRVIPEWAHGSLADLGCGKAPLLGLYRPRCRSVQLIDWANSIHENEFLDIVADLNQPLAIVESESFDTIILSDVLEHIREPAILMSEITRILRPGGTLLLNVPFMYQIHEAPHDYYRYTCYGLDWLATQAGLHIEELTPIGGLVEAIASISSKMLGRLRLFPAVIIIHRLTIMFHRSRLGRALGTQTGSLFPLGYGLVARKLALT